MSKAKRYASSTDVARLAGVSQSAVSRTFSVGRSVAPEMRSKVLAAAATLDYRPSLIPRIMLSHRSNLVAVVLGGMCNPFYSAVLEKLTIGLDRLGYQALMVHVDSGHKLDDVFPRLASYRVDAVVSPLAVLSPVVTEGLAWLKIPVISFNAVMHSNWVSTVWCDNFGAARAVADLFAARGARRFGFVGGPPGSPAAEERWRGFRERTMELGFARPVFAEGDFRYEGGVLAAGAFLQTRPLPEAIFCANDLLAFGLIDTLRTQAGLQAPRDLLVAGFDDIPTASWPAYNLTTCVHDPDGMSRTALEILGRALSGKEHASECITLPAPIIERGTTGGVSDS